MEGPAQRQCRARGRLRRRFVPCITRRAWACPTPGPDAGQCALLPHSGFILEPDFQWLVARGFGKGLRYNVLEVFLNAACAAGSAFGCCGRTESRRNPSAARCLPTVRSCSCTPNSVSIRRLRSAQRQCTTPSVCGSGPGLDPGRQFGLLGRGEPWPATAAAPIGQPGQTFGVVAMHPVA